MLLVPIRLCKGILSLKKRLKTDLLISSIRKGNVMKDSLGNDIKTKKYKTLQCALIETVQSKACRIDGDIEIIQINPNKVLKKDPIGAQSNFEHISARALGDIQALSQTQLEKTKSSANAIPF